MRPWASFPSISLALLLTLCLPALAFAQCLAGAATYRLSTDMAAAQATLSFRTSQAPSAYSDLELVLTLPDRPMAYVFQPTQSQGYGTIYAIPTDPGLEDVSLPMAFFNALPGGRLVPYSLQIPQSGWKAPDAIYVTGLGSALWYATNGDDTPISLPQEMWYRTPCG